MSAAAELLDLVGAELNRKILRLTSGEPRSAEAVAERCDASLPTVYRHVDDLESAGLLTEETQFDAAGNHYKTYAAALQELSVRLDHGDLRVDLETTESHTESDPVPESTAEPGTRPAENVGADHP